MPDMCIDDGIRWRSTYQREVEGHFTIDDIDPSTGEFTGSFFEGEDSTTDPIPIKGVCRRVDLQFEKPSDRPQYIYYGRRVEGSDPPVVKGDRKPATPDLLESFPASEEFIKLLEPGDWVGEKNL